MILLIPFFDVESNSFFHFIATLPAITIKETFKYIMNTKLCKLTGKTLESNQNGILVNVFLDHDAEQMEIKQLDAIAPSSVKNNSKK